MGEPPETDHPMPYGSYYYDHYSGEQYRRGVEKWETFFGSFADHLVREIGPRTVLDAGCAKGFLVEALRDRGVEAFGLDFSEYAIANVRDDIRPYCWAGSLTDELPRTYDLIVCVEVLEHLEGDDAEVAIANLCAHTEDVVFSSTPNDYGEATHVNLHPASWWAERFAQHRFFRDTGYDASFVASWALRLRKRSDPLERVIGSYEGVLANAAVEARERSALVLEQARALEAQERELAELRVGTEPFRARAAELEGELAAVRASTSYRVADRAYRAIRKVAPEGSRRGDLLTRSSRRARRPAPDASEGEDRSEAPAFQEQYRRWMAAHDPAPAALEEQRARSRAWVDPPLISVIVPVFDPAPDWLAECIASVRAQTYAHWELCLADDASRRPDVRSILEEAAAADPRIKVVFRERNGGIASASNSALELATGELVGLLDHDDVLRPHALFAVAERVREEPDAGLLYSDEDKLMPDGTRALPAFKPDWSPDLLLSVNYVCHFTAMRRDLVEKVGGFREGFEGSQDHDLVLRVAEVGAPVLHIADVLYGWRVVPGSAALSADEKPHAWTAGLRAVEDSLRRRGLEATANLRAEPGWYDVRYAVPGDPSVAVIAPPGPDRAAAANDAASAADADLLLFLDPALEPPSGGWTRPMLEQALRREVGAVGCRLARPDGTPFHEGVVLGLGGTVTDADLRDYRAEHGFARGIRNVSAVSGACMMLRRDVFVSAGGFDPSMGSLADVDLCLRLRNYRIIYTPLAELRGPGGRAPASEEELAAFRDRWGDPSAFRDPFISPHIERLSPLTLRGGAAN